MSASGPISSRKIVARRKTCRVFGFFDVLRLRLREIHRFSAPKTYCKKFMRLFEAPLRRIWSPLRFFSAFMRLKNYLLRLFHISFKTLN